ncbi:peptidase S8 [Actinomadura craniellae]|uniref:Peptidase S8 n=1 Tax=Actinomadura craniellae TaxID=2231787 RepID=A0A365GXL0_9ACTN|nr:PatA/PatG family cyanobactin maturation protease [Actinomadura craniellae]RAY11556.1 peptidase S8 [Actinomadura craniellae]
MSDVPALPGLAELWRQTTGDEQIRIAVIDGPVDRDHPVLAGANLSRLAGVWPEEGFAGAKAAHGTAVASVIFGRHDGEVSGIAPNCSGLSIPAFSDRRSKTSQLEIARGIELAVEAGAHVINISGGQLSPSGEAEDVLAGAVRLCQERNVLLVAAAGNDGCFCVHVPAALPSVLAVGALDDSGHPLPMSNRGPEYRHQGILAPGENILVAAPGGGTARRTGTSLAAPIVSGVAALLLCLQVRSGRAPDPLAVRAALLAGADPCPFEEPDTCLPYLSGVLNIERAVEAVTTSPIESTEPAAQTPPAEEVHATTTPCACTGAAPPPPAVVVSAEEPAPKQQWNPLVYAMGVLGYDFGTEARRDSFKQIMSAVTMDGTAVPANPYDARQLVDHLEAHPSEARTLIWTLNLELTPIYAIEPTGPYAADVYQLLTRLLSGETAGEEHADYIERIAIPGRLTGRTVRLFSGQDLPVIEVEQRRGIYGWEVNRLVQAATSAADTQPGDTDPQAVNRTLREFLTRVYYDLRNLGATSRDRALNFAATNAFQAAHTISSAVAQGMALDTIQVEKSPFCRIDSDCWDVKLRFFDPENSRRAKRIYRFTIDVSDILPVTLGDVRTWSET